MLSLKKPAPHCYCFRWFAAIRKIYLQVFLFFQESLDSNSQNHRKLLCNYSESLVFHAKHGYNLPCQNRLSWICWILYLRFLVLIQISSRSATQSAVAVSTLHCLFLWVNLLALKLIFLASRLLIISTSYNPRIP